MAVKVDTQKEIIFGSSDPNISRVLSKKEKDGELRKVAPRSLIRYRTTYVVRLWVHPRGINLVWLSSVGRLTLTWCNLPRQPEIWLIRFDC